MRVACGLVMLLAAGCAGNVADYVGPRTSILGAELVRFGLTGTQASCVNTRLVAALDPLRLRRFERVAATVEEGWDRPGALTVRDLLHVASTLPDESVAQALTGAVSACEALPIALPLAASATLLEGVTELPPPDGAAAGRMAAAGIGARPEAIWLNLGSAGSGQAIALDASTVEQDGRARTGWFRMTDPGLGPSANAYRLRIDCAARTIAPVAHRRVDQSGTIVEWRDYSPDQEPPMPIENGTVTEIAFLSLCT